MPRDVFCSRVGLDPARPIVCLTVDRRGSADELLALRLRKAFESLPRKPQLVARANPMGRPPRTDRPDSRLATRLGMVRRNGLVLPPTRRRPIMALGDRALGRECLRAVYCHARIRGLRQAGHQRLLHPRARRGLEFLLLRPRAPTLGDFGLLLRRARRSRQAQLRDPAQAALTRFDSTGRATRRGFSREPKRKKSRPHFRHASLNRDPGVSRPDSRAELAISIATCTTAWSGGGDEVSVVTPTNPSEPLRTRWELTRNVARKAREFYADVVETHDWAGPLLWRPGCPTIVRMHGAHSAHAQYRGQRPSRFWSRLERRTLGAADLLASVSRAIGKLTLRACRIPRRNFEVIPNGIDTRLFSPQPVEKDPGEILYVGSIHERKGLVELFQAVQTGFRRELGRTTDPRRSSRRSILRTTACRDAPL